MGGKWGDDLLPHAMAVYEKAQRAGWAVVSVSTGNESRGEYSYTVGLFERTGHPDLAGFGLPYLAAATVLNDMAERVVAGEDFETGGARPRAPERFDLQIRQADQNWVVDFMEMTGIYERADNTPVLAVMWPDERGFFPVDELFDGNLRQWQPDLTKPPSMSPAWHAARTGSK